MKLKTSKREALKKTIGLIVGTGVGEKILKGKLQDKVVATAYGKVRIKTGEMADKIVVFLNRHGENYVPPSAVNYHANIAALVKEGVQVILATAAVGAINSKMHPGEMAVLTDFIDFARQRRETFSPRAFVDVAHPYNAELNQKVIQAAKSLKFVLHPKAIYVCTEGPRFESAAEIKAYRRLGADVVGMTQVPEVVLAKEAALPYAAIALVTNYAVGIKPQPVSLEEVKVTMQKNAKKLSALLSAIIPRL